MAMFGVLGTLGVACGPGTQETNATESGGTTTDPSTSTTATTAEQTTIDPSTSTTDSTTTVDPPVTTSTGPGPTTGEPPPECACIVDDPGVEWVDPSLPTCVESICPRVDAAFVENENCDTWCDGNVELDAAALECALVALRDRTPGLIRWSLAIEAEAKTDQGYVWIHDDGTAIWRKWESHDLGFNASAAQVVTLPASEVYTDCLAEPSEQVRFDCLRQSLSSPDNLVCDEAWTARGI